MRVTPVVRRVMLGEAAGFLVGLAIVVFIQTLIPGMLLFQIGLVAWFVTFGAVIGLLGFYDHVPFLDFHLPLWLRGTGTGAWFGLVLALLAYDSLEALFAQMLWLPVLSSPWWVVPEMMVWGLLIDFAVSRVVGKTPWPESGMSEPSDVPLPEIGAP